MRCGEPPGITLDMATRTIHSWESAREHVQSLEWENTTLEAGNALTSFLHDRHMNQYLEWNRLARQAREFFADSVLPQVTLFQSQYGFDERFVRAVCWDILSALMEDAYRVCRPPVNFFRQLLTVYEAGHLPCGWDNGIWPSGELLIF